MAGVLYGILDFLSSMWSNCSVLMCRLFVYNTRMLLLLNISVFVQSMDDVNVRLSSQSIVLVIFDQQKKQHFDTC